MIHEAWPLFAIKAVAIAFAVVLVVAERLRPVQPWNGGTARLGRNVALWISVAVISVAIAAPVSAWAATQSWPWRPSWWSGPLAVLLDLVVLDLFAYAWHRANHNSQLLWRFHQVHHRDTMLDVTSSGRNHPGEVVITAVVRLPLIALFAIPITSVALYEAIAIAAAAFHHTNLALPPRLEKLLSKIIVTPSIHWLHHHAVRADTDSNYSVLFSWWDRLFRSRSRNRRVPGMPLGIENIPERNMLRLFIMPFTPQRYAQERAIVQEESKRAAPS